MKTQEEIEQLAKEYSDIGKEAGLTYKEYTLENIAYIKGYTQCQEDMQKDVEYWQGEFDHWHQQAMEMADKKYTEEDLMSAFNAGINNVITRTSFDKWLNSLNKQD
jgi:hypothetical protein